MDQQPVTPPPDDAQVAPLVATLQQIDRLYAQALRQAEAVDGRIAASEEGMTVDLAVQLHAGATRGDVNVVLTAADVLARMPVAMGLFSRGVFSWGHIRALITGVRRLDRSARDELDAYLGEQADRLERMDPQQRLWALDDAVRLHEPQASAEQPDLQELEQTFMVFSPRLDGSASAYGEFDPTSFTTVSQALDREADTPQAAPPPGDGQDGLPKQLRERRTPRARQLGEALVRLCGRAAVSGPTPADAGRSASVAGAAGPIRATVVVDLDRITDTLAGTLQPAIAGRPPRITRRTLERLSCDAALDVVVTRGHDLLAAKRYAPDVPVATRRAVLARDGGCRFPGCTAPVSWGEIHHVLERARHLDHVPANLVTMCRRHHQMVHRRGWDQTLRPDGSYTLRRRDRIWTTWPRRNHELPPPDPPSSGPDGSAARDGPGPRDGPVPRDGPGSRDRPGRASPTTPVDRPSRSRSDPAYPHPLGSMHGTGPS